MEPPALAAVLALSGLALSCCRETVLSGVMAAERGGLPLNPAHCTGAQPPAKGSAAQQYLFEVATTSLPARHYGARLEVARTDAQGGFSCEVSEDLPVLAALGAQETVEAIIAPVVQDEKKDGGSDLLQNLLELSSSKCSLWIRSGEDSECYTANGADYRGTQNQTSQYAGKPCLFWNETFEHPYNTLKYPNGEGGLGEHNYCRNPDGDVSPWCYIAEHEDGIYWKYCEIPSCRMPGNLGCYKDHGEPPPLTGTSETSNKLTIQTCISSCRSQQFKFAGMESGYACFCGNNPDYWRYGEAASTECNSVCFGDHTQPCGGDGRVILFDTLIGACGGNYTSATAVIYSPDFPDTYGTGKVCYWTIQVPGASQIHFNFALFEIKDSTDMVELLDGYTYHVLARFNGKNRPPQTFNISLDFVILYFFSDEINQAQGFAIRYRAVKDNVHQNKILVNQTFSEKINEQANLSISAARSSKILYVITTSPSHPSSSMPEWTIYSLTALLILSITAIIAKIFLHITMRSHQIPSATETEDSNEVTSAGEIWSIFYQPSTSISIFKKKLRSQQDDCNPLVGN
ncbi:kremen protein 1 [Amazona ochrocephala]